MSAIPKLGADPESVVAPEKTARLKALAKRMAAAKTDAEREQITAEVDKLIGFDTGDIEYDPESLGQWQVGRLDDK